MDRRSDVTWLLSQETRALLTRLAQLKPFMVQETTLPAAALAPGAHLAIERFLEQGRAELRTEARALLRWLRGAGRSVPPARQQERFTIMKVRFTDLLSQFDLYADAITQRSETDTGIWLSGLDVAAQDGLTLPGGRWFEPPELLTYLDRGAGAAIRRARTRLPGDKLSPAAIIRIPRERMVGQGVASSLYHEVGHQGAALLELIPSLRTAIDGAGRRPVPRWNDWPGGAGRRGSAR